MTIMVFFQPAAICLFSLEQAWTSVKPLRKKQFILALAVISKIIPFVLLGNERAKEK